MTLRSDYNDDQPRDENGRWSGSGGSGGGTPKDEKWKEHRVPIKPDKTLYGDYRVGTKEWWEPAKEMPKMSREEARAKVAELRAKAEDVRAKMRAGSWEGTGDNSGWNVASRIESEDVRGALHAGYDKNDEFVNPSFDDLDSISLPGHLYRGMEDAEYQATVGAGKGVHSENHYSVKDIEGTNFGWTAGTAHSYVNSGKSSALQTGKPNYIVEVKPDETVTYNKTAGYPQTPVGEGLSHSRITRVWKFEGRDGNLHMKEIDVPKAKPPEEADLMKGNFGIERKDMPQFERDALPAFLDRMQSRGYGVTYNETHKAADLKASQSTLHMDVVRRMSKANRESPIVISNDGYVLDGHHRWAAARFNDPEARVTAHRIDLPIKQLLHEALNDPNSTRNDILDLEDHMIKYRLDAAIQELLAEKADIEHRLDALRVAQETVTRLDEWDESLHPRAADGKFGEGSGSAPSPSSKDRQNSSSYPGKFSQRFKEKTPDEADRALSGRGSSKSDLPSDKEPSKGLKGIAERVGKSFEDENAAPTLKQDHAKYFNVDKEGTQVVPLDKLLTIRARPTGIENAEKHMAKAYEGQGKKRDPISVSKNGDGTYSVEDGNSTTAIARKHGWDSLPVQVVPATDNGKAAYAEHKVQSSLKDIEHVQEHGKLVKDKKTGEDKLVKLSKDTSLAEHRQIAEKEIAKHVQGLNNFKETLGKTTGVHFEGRTKTLDSALGKVARKPQNYKTAADLGDLTGVRAVTKTVAQSKEVAEKIAKQYPGAQIEEKLEPHQVENGGYRAIHMTVKDHDGLVKEIQIQTERQRAFQEWSHDVYKPQTAEQRAAVGTEKNPGPHRKEALAYGNAMSEYFYNKDLGKEAKAPGRPHPAITKIFGTPRDI